jgi:hypothetical protein
MPETSQHDWEFVRRFRRHAFGWKGSRPAIQRIKEAVAEIKKVARNDPVFAAEGAVRFLEKVSPALEQIDSSSGAIGTAVNHAIEGLVPVISGAVVDAKTRDQWLERLWQAHADDGVPYIERLGDFWGELCVSKEVAADWADRLVGTVERSWSRDPSLRGYFHGTIACLSALLQAQRNDEILSLLEKTPYRMWHYQQWGVKALVALGKKTEALRYAEASRGLNDSQVAIARTCEEILLSSGLVDEAYTRYAVLANQGITHLSTFRAIVAKYPRKTPADILHDLAASTPGQEGKWFAAAKDAGLYNEAIELANRSPCDPKTLTRGARDFADKNPTFATEAGMAALKWLAQGYGYEITAADAWAAYENTVRAAEKRGQVAQVRARIRELVGGDTPAQRWLHSVIARSLNAV